MFTLVEISGGQLNKKRTRGGKGKCRARNIFSALFRHQFVASVRPPSTVRTLFMPRSYYQGVRSSGNQGNQETSWISKVVRESCKSQGF
jgi:hypothetical protein